jgi:Zn-dependent M28 family amino/carboxypeptidase
MNFKAKFVMVLVLVITAGPSILFSEELQVIRSGRLAVNDMVALEGLNVYAILDEAVLAGTSARGTENLLRSDPDAEYVQSLGKRAAGYDYFLFFIERQDIDKLAPGIEVVYYDGKHAIAKVVEGKEFDSVSRSFMRGLTRISFMPRVHVKPGSPNLPEVLFPNPGLDEIVSQVSESTFTAYIQRLQDFVTRYSYTDSCRASELWAVDTFRAMGLDTKRFPFDYGLNTWYDVVGTKEGTVYPDSIYIIVGHIDATSNNPYVEAPGAEDNATGSACVLEAARVLSQYDFDCTIEFLLVPGEEQGLLGSEAYAHYCLDEDKNLGGVLNFDMISYAGSYGWDTNIYADGGFPAEVALAGLLAELTRHYTDAIPVRINTSGPTPGSDHYYFSMYGFPAPFSIDSDFGSDWYPWYHSTDDVIGHLDLDYGTEVVKGGIVTLATLARLSDISLVEFSYPYGFPDIIDPEGGTDFRMEIVGGSATPDPNTGLLNYSTGNGFETVSLEEVTPGEYGAVFPAIDCGEVISWFVSIETVGDSILTDPPAAPDSVYHAYSADESAVVYEDDLSTDMGWTGLGGSGEWGIDVAAGGPGLDVYGGPDPADDNSPTLDNRLLGNDLTLADGDYSASLGDTSWVTSPVIDCSDYFGVSLEFYRWLGVEGNGFDHVYLQAFDGGTWVTIFENGSDTIDDSSWIYLNYDVSAEAAGNSDFQVRFGIGTSDSEQQYCGWNIDDVEITGYSCETGVISPDDPGGLSLPKAFSLAQNRPNPFNPSTTISFEIPGTPDVKQPVTLTVYDIRGRRVKTLVDSELEPGTHRIYWNGRSERGEAVSSGIYLYTLKAGGQTYTRKMTVLK